MTKTKEQLLKEIERALDSVRPALFMHGGNVDLVDFDMETGRVSVRLQGQCLGCPLANLTLKGGIEAALMQMIPEVKEVISAS